MTIRNVTVEGNTGIGEGGGIPLRGSLGSVQVGDSVVRENRSTAGGGIENNGSGTLDRSTLARNTAENGGGLANAVDGTVRGNASATGGAGREASTPGGAGVVRVRRGTVMAALAATVLLTASAPAGSGDPVGGTAPVVPSGAAGGPAGGTVLAAPPPVGTPLVVPAGTGPGTVVVTTSLEPGSAAQVAIDFALAQIGLPYLWGGDGPQAGDAGFDCSGLTTAAYAAAGIGLPRTAQTQYNRGPHVAPGSPLLPGDLVFYGVPSKVHHVGLYLGGGRMVNAPRFGKPVQIASRRWSGDDYLGATRPAAGGSGTGPGGGSLLVAPPPLVALLPPAVGAVPPPTVIDLAPPPLSAPMVPADPPAGLPVPPDPLAPPPDGGTVIAAPPPQGVVPGPAEPGPTVPGPTVPGPGGPQPPVPPGGPPTGGTDPVTPPSGAPSVDPEPPSPAPPSPAPEPAPAPPATVVSGGEIVDVVDATPGPRGTLVLVVGAFTTWPEADSIVVLVSPDGTERRAGVVAVDPGEGTLVVDPG